jgi:hypothetical protein
VLIKNESMQDFCFAREKKDGVCTCLYILREERFHSPMVKYLVDLKLNKSKHEIDLLVLEWYEHASQGVCVCATPHNKLWYNLLYDGSDAYNLNIEIDPLKDALICQEGLYRFMGFSVDQMKSIKICARTTGVMKLHGLCSKKSNNATANTVMSKLMDHFHKLMKLGEV